MRVSDRIRTRDRRDHNREYRACAGMSLRSRGRASCSGPGSRVANCQAMVLASDGAVAWLAAHRHSKPPGRLRAHTSWCGSARTARNPPSPRARHLGADRQLERVDGVLDGEWRPRLGAPGLIARRHRRSSSRSDRVLNRAVADEQDERAILEETHARRIDLTTMGEFWIGPAGGPPTLLVGFGQIPEPAIRTAVSELGQAVQATLARA